MSASAIPSDLDLKEQIARIDRAIAETGKLQEETRKFTAEQHKLAAEAHKLTWDARLLPWFQGVTMLGAVITAAVALWKAFHG